MRARKPRKKKDDKTNRGDLLGRSANPYSRALRTQVTREAKLAIAQAAVESKTTIGAIVQAILDETAKDGPIGVANAVDLRQKDLEHAAELSPIRGTVAPETKMSYVAMENSLKVRAQFAMACVIEEAGQKGHEHVSKIWKAWKAEAVKAAKGKRKGKS